MKVNEKIGATVYAMMKPFLGLIFSGRRRTRILIIHDSEVLLLRNWIGKQEWSMPGGGVKKDEKPEQTIIREVKEELSIRLQENSLDYLFEHQHAEDGARYPVSVYFSRLEQQISLKVRRPEIIEARWFVIDDLPENTNDLVNMAINHYYSKHKG